MTLLVCVILCRLDRADRQVPQPADLRGYPQLRQAQEALQGDWRARR